MIDPAKYWIKAENGTIIVDYRHFTCEKEQFIYWTAYNVSEINIFSHYPFRISAFEVKSEAIVKWKTVPKRLQYDIHAPQQIPRPFIDVIQYKYATATFNGGEILQLVPCTDIAKEEFPEGRAANKKTSPLEFKCVQGNNLYFKLFQPHNLNCCKFSSHITGFTDHRLKFLDVFVVVHKERDVFPTEMLLKYTDIYAGHGTNPINTLGYAFGSMIVTGFILKGKAKSASVASTIKIYEFMATFDSDQKLEMLPPIQKAKKHVLRRS